MPAALLVGFLTGASLIVAIGAQNAYVLRQGLLRHEVTTVVVACALSDAVLITAGVSGVGAVVRHAGWLLDVVRWFGVAFLVWFAVSSLRRAFGSQALRAEGPAGPAAEPRRVVLGRVLALTWLNPHVYLDALLLGSIAATHRHDASAGLDGRWWFALGAAAASVVWFVGLGYGARALAPLLGRPRAWQVLEILIAATVVLVAVKLALG